MTTQTESVTLSEVSQTERQTLYDVIKSKSREHRARGHKEWSVGYQTWGRRVRCGCGGLENTTPSGRHQEVDRR